MTEEDARLALLQAELNGIQSAIRSLDTIDFQIKGWCVTTWLAVGGFAVAYKKPELLFIGLATTIGFFLVNCQFKGIQRAFIRRNGIIHAELEKSGIMQFLKGSGSLHVLGTSRPQWDASTASSWISRAGGEVRRVLHEARFPNTFSLYLFIFACLAAESWILL
jgi:hypothetical protein